MSTARTATSQTTIFHRPGRQAVTYDLSTLDRVTVTLPVASTWTSGPHWHETHTEYLQVVRGRAHVRLADHRGVYGPEDGVIEVPRYTVHEWHRADRQDETQDADPKGHESGRDGDGDGDSDGDLVVREWTAPGDGQKEVFFRMLNSFLTESAPSTMFTPPSGTPLWLRRALAGWIVPVQLFVIFAAWDNWPVMVGDDCGWVSWVMTHTILTLCGLVGRAIGLEACYRPYVSEELERRATSSEPCKQQ